VGEYETSDHARARAVNRAALTFAETGGAELVDVVVVNAPLGPMRVISLELYADGLAVRWIMSRSAGHETSPIIRITDDVGTRYTPAGTGAFGNEHIQRGESCFIPCFPQKARNIRLAFAEHSVTVEARRGGSESDD
jgi:hypothetical protein